MTGLKNSHSNEQSIAIVGGGAAAVSVLAELARRLPGGKDIADRRIDIYGDAPVVGPGNAYRIQLPILLMNTPASHCNAVTDDPQHLARWLDGRFSRSTEALRSVYLPRHVFGEYLEFTGLEARAILRDKGYPVRVIHTRISDITVKARRLLTLSSSAGKFQAKTVILAIGDPKPRPLHVPHRQRGYFDAPWPFEKLADIQKSESILVAGTGASAVDCCLWLAATGRQGPITMLSRHGLLPSVQRTRSMELPPDLHASFLDVLRDGRGQTALDEFIAAIRQDLVRYLGTSECLDLPVRSPSENIHVFAKSLADAKEANRTPQDYFRGMRPFANAFWKKLSDADKEAFDQGYGTAWNLYRHPIAYPIAEKMLGLLESKQVTLDAGVVDFTYNDGAFLAVKRDGSSVAGENLINATGFNLDAEHSDDLLVQNLLKSGLAAPHPRGGIRVRDTYALDGAEAKNLYLLGSLTRGALFSSPSIQAVVEAARTIALDLAMAERNAAERGIFFGICGLDAVLACFPISLLPFKWLSEIACRQRRQATAYAEDLPSAHPSSEKRV